MNLVVFDYVKELKVENNLLKQENEVLKKRVEELLIESKNLLLEKELSKIDQYTMNHILNCVETEGRLYKIDSWRLEDLDDAIKIFGFEKVEQKIFEMLEEKKLKEKEEKANE